MGVEVLLLVIPLTMLGVLVGGIWFIIDDYKSGHTRKSEKFFGDD